jgi:hypothetical protein
MAAGRRRRDDDCDGNEREETHMRRWLKRNPFGFLFASSRRDGHLVQYVLREHRHGRQLDEILDDPYLRNRATPAQRARLLDEPDVVAAIGERSVADLRLTVGQGG